MDIAQIAIQYQAPSFRVEILRSLGATIDPKTLQEASDATQQWNEFLKGLVLGYNSCAITSEQYAEGLQKIYPRLKEDASRLNQLAGARPTKQGKLDDRQVERLVERYLANLRAFGEISGQLMPANDPDPPTHCSKIPNDAIKIFLGNSTAWTDSTAWTGRVETTILSVAGQKLLSIRKIGGAVAISARIYSRDGRIVAEIVDNFFRINPNNYFRREHPDASTLVVYDQYNRKVLDVRYLNRLSLKFLGIFDFPDRRPVVIEEEQQKLGIGVSAGCFGNNETILFLP